MNGVILIKTSITNYLLYKSYDMQLNSNYYQTKTRICYAIKMKMITLYNIIGMVYIVYVTYKIIRVMN